MQNVSHVYCFLTQACASHRLVRTWFLKIVSVWTSVCVCVSAPEAINNDWLNKFYSCYMATVVIIVNGRGLGIGTRYRH